MPIAEKFKTLLFGLNDSEDGKLMLDRLPISGFEEATDRTYQPVIEFLEVFSKQVRPVAW
jgi:phosphonate transport system substrate-binding protein